MKHYKVKGKNGINYAKWMMNNYWYIRNEAYKYAIDRQTEEIIKITMENKKNSEYDYQQLTKRLYNADLTEKIYKSRMKDNNFEFAGIGTMNKAVHLNTLSNDSEYWIGDTGASTHMTYCKDGMIFQRSLDKSEVIMGNGSKIIEEGKGSLYGQTIGKNDREKNTSGYA